MTLTTRQITATALMIALTAVSAFLVIPLGPVPATMQSGVVLTAGAILGSRLGALSQVVYLIMGVIGFPVFAGGKSGPGIVTMPTFGYLIGFIFAAYLAGYLIERRPSISLLGIGLSMVAGVSVLLLCGVLYLYVNLNYLIGQETTWPAAFSIGVLPFLPVEALKICLAAGVVYSLKKYGLSFMPAVGSKA